MRLLLWSVLIYGVCAQVLPAWWVPNLPLIALVQYVTQPAAAWYWALVVVSSLYALWWIKAPAVILIFLLVLTLGIRVGLRFWNLNDLRTQWLLAVAAGLIFDGLLLVLHPQHVPEWVPCLFLHSAVTLLAVRPVQWLGVRLQRPPITNIRELNESL
jgi:hypothetical protein